MATFDEIVDKMSQVNVQRRIRRFKVDIDAALIKLYGTGIMVSHGNSKGRDALSVLISADSNMWAGTTLHELEKVTVAEKLIDEMTLMEQAINAQPDDSPVVVPGP